MFTLQKLKKSVRITVGTLLIYALLVATHLGEFWPFSIYPMFSQAGNPWKRAIVQDVTQTPADSLWLTATPKTLPGKTIPLDKLNVNTNDIANYLSKTDVWTPNKVYGVRRLVQKRINGNKIMVYQARGSLVESDSIKIEFVPFIYLTQDTTILNKTLKTR